MPYRSIELVQNREVKGCFGADVQGLSGVHQDDVHRALADSGLYSAEDGVFPMPGAAFSDSMRGAGLPVRFEDKLPFFNGFEGDEAVAMDNSSEAAIERLMELEKTLREDDHRGLIIMFPCQREPGQDPFAHYVAAVEPRQADAALTVMDPSELPGHGGIFQRSREEVLSMLTPDIERMIPVLAYALRLDDVADSPVVEADAGAFAEIEVPAEEVKVGQLVGAGV